MDELNFHELGYTPRAGEKVIWRPAADLTRQWVEILRSGGDKQHDFDTYSVSISPFAGHPPSGDAMVPSIELYHPTDEERARLTDEERAQLP